MPATKIPTRPRAGKASARPIPLKPVADMAEPAAQKRALKRKTPTAKRPAPADDRPAKASAKPSSKPTAHTVADKMSSHSIAPAPAAAKPAKAPKHKLVRDSFAMPEADFALIHLLKERALGFRRPTKKSELLRAGLQALAALSPTQLQTALGRLTALKPGRPRAQV